MCYSSQVWGFKQYNQVEKLLRYFIKRMFNLPSNTPNYMLHIETELHSSFLYTLKIHFNYITKIINYSNERYPKLLASEIIEKNIYWAKEWNNLFQYANVNFSFDNATVEWRHTETGAK